MCEFSLWYSAKNTDGSLAGLNGVQTRKVVKSPAEIASKIPAGLNRSAGSRSLQSGFDTVEGNSGDGTIYMQSRNRRQFSSEP